MAIQKRIVVYAQDIRDSTHLKLQSDEANGEHVSAWSNRDLTPLPPVRRTWGFSNYFGFWAVSSMNATTWQIANTFLTEGLSVGQAMGVIIVSNAIIYLFATLVARCGLRWHIGFTLQNRFTWGMRGSFIPLLQRVLLNFIWTAVQCWNGGRFIGICLTALWPSYQNIPNTFGPSMPTTTVEFTGFVIFWFISLPMIFVRPENFKRFFQFTTAICGIAMLCLMIWSLAVAKGVGPVFSTGAKIPSGTWLNSSWLMLSGINQTIGGLAAGMTNGSDFSRYGRNSKSYYWGSFLALCVLSTLVSFVGLVTTAASQVIYGRLYWNPPDLFLAMMDNGKGSSASRCAAFFLSLAFAMASMFQNICGNAVAGGIDLAGLSPRYIDLRRGALITFLACWLAQPWQLINRASTFLQVLSSFSVFLAPLMGVMAADYYVLRRQDIKLTELYQLHHGSYWFYHGFNLRVILPWLAGWAPTVVGLVAVVNEKIVVPIALRRLYTLAFFYGFFSSAVLFIAISKLFPPAGLGEKDAADIFGTFTLSEAKKVEVEPTNESQAVEDMHGSDATAEVKSEIS